MKKILLLCVLPFIGFSQGYTSYFTGNSFNITTTPEFGVCLMGGATEHDNAMIWLLQKANGGDVVVLRSSGSNGYNDYLYSELGVTVNSVETLVITSVAGATNPYVLNKVANAEMIWFAGGDQYNYVSYFKDNALEDLINNHVNVKNAPIGGTSAGMAILGQSYFSAQNGTVTSAQALANPYHPNITIGGSFLNVPFMQSVITDSHYDNPDRKGRHAVFMARIGYGNGSNQLLNGFYGIACNEYVAVCVGSDGKAHVYGDYPNYEEFAYFLQADCTNYAGVSVCQPGQPLHWTGTNGKALNVYKVPGTMNGDNYFDLSDWEFGTNSGGTWENWAINNGVLSNTGNFPPACNLNNDDFISNQIELFPNPFQNHLSFEKEFDGSVEIYDSKGVSVFFREKASRERIDTSNFQSGLYIVKITTESSTFTKKILKE